MEINYLQSFACVVFKTLALCNKHVYCRCANMLKVDLIIIMMHFPNWDVFNVQHKWYYLLVYHSLSDVFHCVAKG